MPPKFSQTVLVSAASKAAKGLGLSRDSSFPSCIQTHHNDLSILSQTNPHHPAKLVFKNKTSWNMHHPIRSSRHISLSSKTYIYFSINPSKKVDNKKHCEHHKHHNPSPAFQSSASTPLSRTNPLANEEFDLRQRMVWIPRRTWAKIIPTISRTTMTKHPLNGFVYLYPWRIHGMNGIFTYMKPKKHPSM